MIMILIHTQLESVRANNFCPMGPVTDSCNSFKFHLLVSTLFISKTTKLYEQTGFMSAFQLPMEK